jgi:hypothetical protein
MKMMLGLSAWLGWHALAATGQIPANKTGDILKLFID